MALGDPRLEHGRVFLPAHQAVVDVEADGDATDVEGRMRVDRVVVALVGEDETGLAGLGGNLARPQADAGGKTESRDTGESRAARLLAQR